jgi:hypothetical protein
MTEGDKAFYKRRIREELKQARNAESSQLEQLHRRWALLYQERLDQTSKAQTGELEAKLSDGGVKVDGTLASRPEASAMHKAE